MKKRKGILDYIIYFLVFCIVITFIGLMYILFTTHYTVTFVLNGADSVEEETRECSFMLIGCRVTLPKASRSDGVILGYSTNPQDTVAQYEMDKRITLSKNTTLYVISYKKYTVQIDKNDVDYLESETVSCNSYNEQESCSVKLPKYNKVGYVTAGYSTQKNENYKTLTTYHANEKYEIKNDLKLYTKYHDYRGVYGDIKRVYKTNNVFEINGSYIEAETGTPQGIIDSYIKNLKEINEKAPFLFNNSKIFIINSSTFNSMWASNNVWSTNTIGINYGSSIMGDPLARVIDLKYDAYQKDTYNRNYYTMVHEMSHSWDFIYPYRLTGKVPKVGDNGSIDDTYGVERISAQKDFIDLYNEYCNKYSEYPVNKLPLSPYAYTNELEFFAEMFEHYYFKYLVPLGEYKDKDFPEDMKKILEKYICIAKNNYKSEGCS